MKSALVKVLAWLYGTLLGRKARYTRPIEANYAYMSLGDKLWWVYKNIYREVEEPERGSGIEDYFARQDFDFGPPEDFVEQSRMTLTAGGDILSSRHFRPDNMGRLFDDVRGFFFDSDIAFANLETPVAAGKAPGFVPKDILKAPGLNNSPEIFDRVAQGGATFDLYSTANNHALDQGPDGLVATLDFLDSRGFPHVGTSRSEAEREELPILTKNGVSVAFLAYTFSLNGKVQPEGQEYLVNYLRLNKPDEDISMIERHVRSARERGADIVVACLHWSLEFEAFPASNVIAMGHRIAELGVDFIAGNHAHGVQPIERYDYVAEGGAKRSCLIAYALGDLMSLQERVPNSRVGAIARLEIAAGTLGGRRIARIASLALKPTYQYAKIEADRCSDFRVLDLEKLAADLREGKDELGLGPRGSAEILRLEAHARRVLKPSLYA
jgi:Putative enzyme of poly-gamma-glutamate biosynthesis (capsule formation)